MSVYTDTYCHRASHAHNIYAAKRHSRSCFPLTQRAAAALTLTGALAAGSAAYFCCLSVMYSRCQAVPSATSPCTVLLPASHCSFSGGFFSGKPFSQGRPATTCVCGGYACNACNTHVHTQCVWCAAILASSFRTEHLVEGCHLSGGGEFITCSLHNRCACVCVRVSV